MEKEHDLSNKLEVPIQAFRYFTFERRLDRIRQSPVPEPVLEAYMEYRPLIESVYGMDGIRTDLLYHGTGLLRYGGNGQITADRPGTEPVLERILAAGLFPSADSWIPTPGSMPTVSLTKSRFYAKWYADICMGRNNRPVWSFGDSADWVLWHLFDSWRTEPAVLKAVEVVFFGRRDSVLVDDLELFRRWILDVRNDVTHGTKYMNIFRGLSTIPVNFGILFAIRPESIRRLDMPLLSAYETRTPFLIPPSEFAAMEVPMGNIRQTRDIADASGYRDLPVLPMEAVDYHFSRFGFSEQTVRQRFAPSRNRNGSAVPENVDSLRIPAYADVMMAASGRFGDPYHPYHLLRELEKIPYLAEQFGQIVNWEGQTLRYHTLSVMLQLEKYFPDGKRLPGNVRREFFRTFLGLHDGGKPESIRKRDRKHQSAYNRRVAYRILSMLKFPDREILLADTLLSADPVGRYLQRIGTLLHIAARTGRIGRDIFDRAFRKKAEKARRNAVRQIRDMAGKADMPAGDFFDLLVLYHIVDASAYTRDGGSVGSLDYVFAINPETQSISYSPYIEAAIREMKAYL